MSEAEPSSPSPPPRVEWQVQGDEGGGWVGGVVRSDEDDARYDLDLAKKDFPKARFRLVRRSWRLESEEVVDDG